MPSLVVNNRIIHYTHQQKRRMKNTYLSVKKEGVHISSPFSFSARDAERLILAKMDWIIKKQALMIHKHSPELHFNPEHLLYLGNSYSVLCEVRRNIVLEEGCFKVPRQNAHHALRTWYKNATRLIVESYLPNWEMRMGVKATDISYRYYKRRWGCCRSDDRITFASTLSQLPLWVVEYIIVHELAHIKHKNHSRDFYAYVARYYPKYKKAEAYLKGYGASGLS